MPDTIETHERFPNRALWALILPMIAENLLSVIAGTVDTVMVSSVGEAAVSAVSLVDSLCLLFISMFFALTLGGSVVVAQYIGKGSLRDARDSANQLVYSTTAVALFFALIVIIFNEQILRLLYGRVEPTVFQNAKTYLFYIAVSFPFAGIQNAACSIYRAMAKSKISLAIATGASVLNVIGNALLIYVFKLGVEGAAISTLFSRVAGAAIGVILLHNREQTVYFDGLFRFRLRFDIINKILKIGVPNGIEGCIFHIGKVSIQSLVATFGTVSIAANAVANTVCNFGWTVSGAYSNVALTVVGQCMGAGEVSQAEKYTKKLIMMLSCAILIVFAALYLLRFKLAECFGLTPETTAEAARLIGLGSVLTCVALYPCSFVLLSALRAAGDARYAVLITIFTMLTFRVLGSYALGGWLGLGITGVWIAMALDWFSRAVCNLIRFKQGKWKRMKVI